MLQFEADSHEITNLEIRSPLTFIPGQSKIARLSIGEDDRHIYIESRVRFSEETWNINAVARLSGEGFIQNQPRLDISRIAQSGATRISADQHYANAAARSLFYGPSFQGIEEVFVDADQAVASIRLPDTITQGDESYHLHPCALDACFQLGLNLYSMYTEGHDPLTLVPYRADRIVYFGGGEGLRYCRARLERPTGRNFIWHFDLFDGDGLAIAQITGCRFRSVDLGSTRARAKCFEFHAVPQRGLADETPTSLPAPAEIVQQISKSLAIRAKKSGDRDDYHGRVLPMFDALMSAYALRAIHQLNDNRPTFAPSDLMEMGVKRDQAAFLVRVLNDLADDDLASCTDGVWTITHAEEFAAPEDIWRSITADHPIYLPELNLVGRCGRHLPAILRGDIDASEILTPSKSPSAYELLHDASKIAQDTRFAIHDALDDMFRNWVGVSGPRLLEMTNAAPGIALDLLYSAPPGTTYVFAGTEEETVFEANQKLGGQYATSARPLDLDLDLEAQGIAAQRFDVVIMLYALEASSDPRRLLNELQHLMTRNGVLLVLETPPQRAADFVFGVQPHWWRKPTSFEDSATRLLSFDELQNALTSAGFTDVRSVSRSLTGAGPAGTLLVARSGQEPQIPEHEAPPEPPRVYVLLRDAAGESRVVGDHLGPMLKQTGNRLITVETGSRFSRSGAETFVVDPTESKDYQRVFEILEQEDKSCTDLVHLVGYTTTPDTDSTDLIAAQEARCLSTARLTQGLAALDWPTSPRLWLVTAGAAVYAGDKNAGHPRTIASQAPLWGLGRVLMNEQPELQCTLVDVCADAPIDVRAGLLARELREAGDENEILLTQQHRYVLRLQATDLRSPGDDPATRGNPPGRPAFKLSFDKPGSLRNLFWRDHPTPELQRNEIRIQVRATGLNFRNIMFALGMLPEDAMENGFAGATLGMECAGDVAEIGPDVTDFSVGDAVLCFASGCFASQVVTSADLAVPKPADWSYAEAATVPIPFFTAYYALEHLARLQPGEKVLIHGAAGGVGLAAIQYCRFRGAQIFATAGSSQKRDFLHLLGVDHVYDSRSLRFAGEILADTDGIGVDVVLNSLSGEAITRNLDVLKPFGRFLELGKRDYYANTRIGLRPFANNISYFGVDADQLLAVRRDAATRILAEVMALFEKDALRPLVHQVFSCPRVTDAFRHMQQSRHIGKIVLSYDDEVSTTPVAKPPLPKLALNPAASYLVTGGLRGFGLATARWLVKRGARTVILIGRTGADSLESQAGVAELTRVGVRVHVYKVDVTDDAQLDWLFREIEQQLPPLRGIVHAAMVLDDALAQNLNEGKLRSVLAPKMLGAWKLHLRTTEIPLDFFVMHSSATTFLGNPGQSNYVAANYYLEALAQVRRAEGLPALAVSWGPIGDVGALARNETLKEALSAKLGGATLKSGPALAMLEQLVLTGGDGLAIIDLDWKVVGQTLPTIGSRKFELVAHDLSRDGVESAVTEDVRAMVTSLSESEGQKIILTLASELVSQVLHMSIARLDVNVPVQDLGMDSLMAAELHTLLQTRLGVHFPVMAIAEGLTVKAIAERVYKTMSQTDIGESTTEVTTAREALDALATRHGEALADEDMVDLLTHLDSEAGTRRLTQ